MRTPLSIDDDLYEKALSLAAPGSGRSELLKECVKAFIQRARRCRRARVDELSCGLAAAPTRSQPQGSARLHGAARLQPAPSSATAPGAARRYQRTPCASASQTTSPRRTR